jgi:AcrR family transcriptional regulator
MAEVSGASSPKGRATRERIFEAATAEFALKGFAGARIDVIARKAEINKQRIYAYFGDKDGLFTEVWKHTFELIYEKNREFLSLKEKDIPHLGRIILNGYMAFHERHPEFWRIFVMENLFGGKHGRPGHVRGDSPYTHLRELYELGQKKGFNSPEVSFETFIFVLTGISFFYTSNMRTMSDTLETDLSDPEIKTKLMREICFMMFDGAECQTD